MTYYGLRSYLPTDHPDKAAEIGSECTPDVYIAALVEVFRELRRVLRDDGTLWLNLGDSYAGNGINRNGLGNSAIGSGPAGACKQRNIAGDVRSRVPDGLKPKDLMMMPARVALALQADGWWLRSDIIWAKPNPMPESVTDRPTSAHEHVFLLAKSATYFYDADAVRETGTIPAGTLGAKGSVERFETAGVNSRPPEYKVYSGTRNLRNVWTIATAPFSEAHFATFPPALVERCVKAGSRPGDTVLDPFSGAGTTAMVADRLGRHAIGIDLSAAYSTMSCSRIRDDAGLFADINPDRPNAFSDQKSPQHPPLIPPSSDTTGIALSGCQEREILSSDRGLCDEH